jgi:hypothetical protein
MTKLLAVGLIALVLEFIFALTGEFIPAAICAIVVILTALIVIIDDKGIA